MVTSPTGFGQGVLPSRPHGCGVVTRPDLITELAIQIGPRMAGSDASARAARVIADVMAGAGLEVRFQEFEFVGYDPDEPTLEIDGARWQAAPSLYARAASVEGEVRFLGAIDDGTGETLAFVIESGDGSELAWLFAAPFGAGAVPLGSVLGPTLTGVSAVISTEDGHRLREIGGGHARLETRGVLVPGQRERNVLGYLPGASDEYVAVSSHFDSVWRGPGVLDNATGVEGMMQVMERLRGARPPSGVLACAFSCEEIGLLGSRYFVTEAKLRGVLDQIVGVVNLDAIAHGDALEISVQPAELEERVLATADDLGVSGRYPFTIRTPQADADDFYFAQEGIPSASFVHFPYPEYHSTREALDLVDADRMTDTVALATATVEQLLESPIRWSPPNPVRHRTVPK
jgi:Iap family predicted aminopeptidase